MAKKIRPTESELEILQVLWSQGPCTVRQVNDRLNRNREVGYTTTLKLLQIMTDKGLVRRDSSKRTHVFEAAISEAQTQRGMIQRLIDTAFHGSAGKLALEALGQHRASPEEIQRIRALLDQLEQQEASPNKRKK